MWRFLLARVLRWTSLTLARPRGSRKRLHNLFWNAYAVVYDGLPRHFRPYTEQLERVLAFVQDLYPSTSARILDAGCGTGNYLMELHKRGYEAAVGLDSATWMLRRADLKLTTRTSAGNVLNLANLTAKLPFRDGSFDCVLSVNALYMLPNPDATLTEFCRVLRPGGTVIVSHPEHMPSLLQILKEHARKYGLFSVLRAGAAFLGIGAFNLVIARNFADGSYTCWSDPTMREAFRSAGLAAWLLYF
jgi:SAM-dependent methyltransferase